MQKKILIKLISPKMSLRPMDSEFKRRMSPSLSLVTIASLTPSPHEVCIEDENIHLLNFDDNPDLVGITVNVDTSYRAVEIARTYMERGISVILGGIHASADPGFFLPHCDSICIGEAEEIWGTIINDFIEGKLQKTYCHEGITDLVKVPLPLWAFVDKKKYLYNNIIVTSRGCPFKCEFCYNSCEYVKNGFRNRPLAHVLEEISRLDTKQVMFIDDNLIGNVVWMKEFLDAIINKNLIWHGAVSTNLVQYPELIRKMAESGCRSLFIGFESINAESICSVNKRQNKIGEYEILIRMLHENGIMVNASMVFGFDDDTADTFDQTLKWLVKNKVETMTTHILTPYPGTKLYKRLEKEGRIIERNLRKYNTSNVVFEPRNMSAEELRDGYLSMYKKFYSLRNIIKRRPSNKRLIAPYFMFNLGYRKFGRVTAFLGKMGLMNRIGKLGRKLAYGID